MSRSSGKGGAGRRTFLKTVALAGGISGVEGQQQAATPATRTSGARAKAAGGIEYPRKFTGRQLARVAFPLGGVGAGSVSLGGRGQLRDWEIFNRPDKGRSLRYSFASVWVQRGSRKPFASVLESQIAPPYEGSSGLGADNVPGMPRLTSATFTGEFPLAHIDFEDANCPVSISLDAFTPFIPLDADASGLPVAILRYTVKNPAAMKANVAIAFSIDNPVGTQGRSNDFRSGEAISGLLMRNPFLSAMDPMAGSFALATTAKDAKITSLRGWRSGTGWRVGPLLFWDDFTADGELGPEERVRDSVGSLCVQKSIAARSQAEFTFVLGWHFPNRTPDRCGWSAPEGEEAALLGNHYATRFQDAWEAVEFAAMNLPDLEKRTRTFAAVLRESAVPGAVKEAASANLSTLITPTSFRIADGTFHGFEGSNDQRGCCFGNCTHVWNYEVATAYLFPSLARSLRENAFGYSTDERGHQAFRQILPDGRQRFGTAAADGQMGQIMHLYLDWILSGDSMWLRSMWPAAKRALEFAWTSGGWDGDKDGVMEGVQHNTYDVEFYGPNPLCEFWYLGALRAGEEMARAVGDDDAAKQYRTLFDAGSKWTADNLFNGEYFFQKIRGVKRADVAEGLMAGMGASDTENPDFQVGEGCLVDQLLGQYMADIAGLGNLVDAAQIRKTLDSIYKYNYKRSMYQHESVQRTYALNDEAALVICDYAGKPRPKVPFPYFAEVMTGFEYAAAVLMMTQGQTARGIELIANIRRRYDGERRNPWNEAECGHHYARAMASWAGMVALSGFHYNGVQTSLRVQPRVNAQNFKCVWSTGTGWGSFAHTGSELRVIAIEGALPIISVELAWMPKAAQVGGKAVAFDAKERAVVFRSPAMIAPGAELVIRS